MGDKVMQIKNNYNLVWKIIRNGKLIDEGLGIYNGDEGLITFIDNDNEYIEVLFDGERVVHYDFTQLDELELSYAVTIHKSQGSEYKAVIIPVHSGPPMLLTRNLIYTAVTRAKELVVLIGIPETLKRMIDNNRETSRYTALAEKIRYFDNI
jgi:exodeoxyribonuclease V alpha subunit